LFSVQKNLHARPLKDPYVGEPAIIIGVVESIPHQEAVVASLLDPEGGPFGNELGLAGGGPIHEDCDPKALRLAGGEVIPNIGEGHAGVDHIVDNQDVVAFDRNRGPVENLNRVRPALGR
jgi:hypothetical protein